VGSSRDFNWGFVSWARNRVGSCGKTTDASWF
jgi:hypothetical protein